MRHLRRRFLILDIRNELLDARMATSTNNSIGAVPKANFPEILAQVLGKFFPDVSGGFSQYPIVNLRIPAHLDT